MNRAWVIHSLKNAIMILLAIFGDASWEVNPNSLDDATKQCIDFNEEFANTVAFMAKTTIYIMLCLGLILDLICWRYRKVSSLLFYFENALMIVVSLLPSNFNKHFLGITMRLLFCVVAFACQARGSIIFASLMTLCYQFFIHPNIYSGQMTSQ